MSRTGVILLNAKEARKTRCTICQVGHWELKLLDGTYSCACCFAASSYKLVLSYCYVCGNVGSPNGGDFTVWWVCGVHYEQYKQLYPDDK